MVWGLLIFVLGIVYGYVTPGRQNKMELFKKGIIIGIILALVFALIGFVSGFDALGLGAVGALSVLIAVVVLTVLFVLGAWIGDFIEGAAKKA